MKSSIQAISKAQQPTFPIAQFWRDMVEDMFNQSWLVQLGIHLAGCPQKIPGLSVDHLDMAG